MHLFSSVCIKFQENWKYLDKSYQDIILHIIMDYLHILQYCWIIHPSSTNNDHISNKFSPTCLDIFVWTKLDFLQQNYELLESHNYENRLLKSNTYQVYINLGTNFKQLVQLSYSRWVTVGDVNKHFIYILNLFFFKHDKHCI